MWHAAHRWGCDGGRGSEAAVLLLLSAKGAAWETPGHGQGLEICSAGGRVTCHHFVVMVAPVPKTGRHNSVGFLPPQLNPCLLYS